MRLRLELRLQWVDVNDEPSGPPEVWGAVDQLDPRLGPDAVLRSVRRLMRFLERLAAEDHRELAKRLQADGRIKLDTGP